MSEYSPMMQKYLETKEEYSDCILFYRLGDFYEMFFEDAKIVSKELDLVLTGKNCGMEERAPMCGVPYHAADSYISRLVKAGYKVAICEQMEDPKTTKGIVRREVIRIVTPATNMDTQALSEDKNNFLGAVMYEDGRYGMAFADASTGDFFATELEDASKVMDEYRKFSPSELIVGADIKNALDKVTMQCANDSCVVTAAKEPEYTPEILLELVKNQFSNEEELRANKPAALAAGAVLLYLKETQQSDLTHITSATIYTDLSYMLLDAATRRNLELAETMRDKSKKGSLFGVLDRTKTAMGARLLRSYIEQPLVDVKSIRDRQDCVEILFNNKPLREELRELLDGVYDLERLLGRISYMTANPRDMIAFKNSIGVLKDIHKLLADESAGPLGRLCERIDTLEDIFELVDSAIDDDPPIAVHDGGIIQSGFAEEVDHLRSAQSDGKQWLSKLEEEERQKTGIKNLKIKYNKVFGYYLEVTNSYKDMVPDYFIRKQTLTNAERFFTSELKELENTILSASERLTRLEYDIYKGILTSVSQEIPRIQTQAKLLAVTDVLCALADAAVRNRYVRPVVTNEDVVEIRDGRHPVIEKMLEAGTFIANDTFLDEKDTRVSIITGPNMAGKSTYMRQTALIVLMAQMGSFVPAKEARIGVCDRIFTRVGASDDLASGQSTFMVEMNEVANILKHATKDSLLILDEIGRGTSTFDGLAIAWAVVEHIADPAILGAKTLFATHYHELTELEGKLDGVKNFCIAVKEQGEDIVFLRKIIPGGADKSYGIQVARLAGVPDEVTNRAKLIVNELVENDVAGVIKEAASMDSHSENRQLSFFDRVAPYDERQKAKDDIYEELLVMSPDEMTPREALDKLYELQRIAKEW